MPRPDALPGTRALGWSVGLSRSRRLKPAAARAIFGTRLAAVIGGNERRRRRRPPFPPVSCRSVPSSNEGHRPHSAPPALVVHDHLLSPALFSTHSSTARGRGAVRAMSRHGSSRGPSSLDTNADSGCGASAPGERLLPAYAVHTVEDLRDRDPTGFSVCGAGLADYPASLRTSARRCSAHPVLDTHAPWS